MSAFYKMDPAKWDFGTANLSLEEEAAYLRIINAIHKHDGPVPDNDRVLSGLFRTSTRKARALVAALVVAGKLVIEGGQIWNERARSDLVHRGFTSVSRAESGAKGGRKRAENAAKALETNNPPQANASSRIEENREEEREAIASPKNEGSRGTRLPRDWQLPSDWAAWAEGQGVRPEVVRREGERFRDYWISKPGKDGTKLDWQATWRNWMRKHIGDKPAPAYDFWTGPALN
jgi:uncharacterized protein YdaU (DUF1376 family)